VCSMSEYIYWIWFSRAIKAGKRAMSLLSAFSDPEKIWKADSEALGVFGLTPKEKERLEEKDLSEAEKILEITHRKGIGLVHLYEEGYPSPLRAIPEPPILLYYYGKLPDFGCGLTIGVIGTRNATDYGRNIAGNLRYRLAAAGITVVSGMAAGIDGVATRGAIQAPGETRPVAVLGTAIDKCYPAENEDIYKTLKERGAVISEYAPGSPGSRYQFPERNRIVSGLCRGIVVIEAPEKSGSLITCDLAQKYQKDIFAVPGNLGLPTFMGSNRLLAEGKARMTVSLKDIVGTYHYRVSEGMEQTLLTLPLNEKPPRPVKVENGGDELQEKLVGFLRKGEKTVDELSIETGLSVSEILIQVTMLEMTGRLCNRGGRYSLRW